MSFFSRAVLAVSLLAACSDDDNSCPTGAVERNGLCVEVTDAEVDGGDGSGSRIDAAMEDGATKPNDKDSGGKDDKDAAMEDKDAAVEDAAVADSAIGMDAEVDSGLDAGVDSAVPCVPTGAESCNDIDDDCDGKTDEGMLSASATTQWDLSTAMTSATQRAFASVLPRAAGGAYLLYKATAPDATAATTETGASPLSVVLLSSSNQQTGVTQNGLLPDSRSYLAASYGLYVAVLYHAPDADGDSQDTGGETKLALFKDNGSGVLVQKGNILTLTAFQTDMSGLSINETDAGELRILVAYSDASDNTQFATGLAEPFVHAIGLNEGTGQMYSVQAATPLINATTTDHAGATVRIVRRPCGAGWIIGYFDPPSAQAGVADREVYLKGVSIDGELAAQPLWSSGLGFSFQGLGVRETCSDGAARVLLLLGTTAGPQVAYELAWSDEPADDEDAGGGYEQGSVTDIGNTPVFATAVPAQISWHQGLWYAALRSTGAGVTDLLELDVPTDFVRSVISSTDIGNASAKHVRDINMYFAPLMGVSNVSDGVLVTFSNSTIDPSTSPLGPETAAITYKLGCP